MSSLTQAALVSKKAFFFIVVIISVVIAIMIFLGIGKNIKNAIFPPKDVPAAISFGKVPAPDVSDGYQAPLATSYDLQTISGSLSTAPSIGKVFGVIAPDPSFGSTEKIKDMAASVGFRTEPVQIEPGVLKFVDKDNENKTLTVDSSGQNFTLDTNYFNNIDILSTRPESEESAIRMATTFFNRYGLDLSEFPVEKIQTRRMRIDGTKLTETPALGSANLVQVNFLQGDIDKIPVYWAKAGDAGVYALASERELVYAKSVGVPVKKAMFSTYPLKSPASAFEDLKNGLGAFDSPVNTTSMTILDASLGYVVGEKTKDFLVPFYVFKTAEGPNGYVNAVDSVWVN